MKIGAVVFMLVSIFSVSAYAADERSRGDDFLSSTVGSVFDKVGQYTSGEKSLFESENAKPDRDEGYERDALGNRVPDTSIKSVKTSSPDKQL